MSRNTWIPFTSFSKIEPNCYFIMTPNALYLAIDDDYSVLHQPTVDVEAALTSPILLYHKWNRRIAARDARGETTSQTLGEHFLKSKGEFVKKSS